MTRVICVRELTIATLIEPLVAIFGGRSGLFDFVQQIRMVQELDRYLTAAHRAATILVGDALGRHVIYEGHRHSRTHTMKCINGNHPLRTARLPWIYLTRPL